MKRRRRLKIDQGPSEQLRRSRSMRLKLTLLAFFVMVVAGSITVAIYYVILKLLGQTPMILALTVNPVFAGIVVLGACGLIATLLFAWLSKVYLRPMKRLME